jgi:hypothetical protein
VIVTAAAVALITCFWIAYSWMPRPEVNSESPNVDRPIADEASTVPLWDFDGMREVQVVARRLEERARNPTIDQEIDLWQRHADQIRRQLAELIAGQNLIFESH